MDINTLFGASDSLLTSAGVSEAHLPPLSTLAVAVVAVVTLAIIYYILSRPVAAVVNRYVLKSETQTDDILLSPAIVRALCMLVTAWLAAIMLPAFSFHYPQSHVWLARLAYALRIVAVAHILLLESEGVCLYLRQGDTRRSGVLVLRNILKSAIIAVSVLLIVSTLMGRSLASVCSALGAMAAVLMLVFRDSILGMMAGIRLSTNGMLKENDWVSVPKYNADGRVEDVSLSAVKIRNWDKSISSIPPHALVSEGFINRESMLEAGVRQLKRVIYIDATSVRRMHADELSTLPGGHWLTDESVPPRVNLSLFRRYVRHKLMSHPRRAQSDIHPLQVMVRELPATPEGIPLELFFFVDCPDWEEFEMLQADLLDEVTARVADFDLRLFQSPTGADLRLSRCAHNMEKTL